MSLAKPEKIYQRHDLQLQRRHICIYVNTEDAYSKTNEPMIWNKPSDKQLEK
ncbi:hypothetical protein D910_12174 [Dendroctonus ponderosae]